MNCKQKKTHSIGDNEGGRFCDTCGYPLEWIEGVSVEEHLREKIRRLEIELKRTKAILNGVVRTITESDEFSFLDNWERREW